MKNKIQAGRVVRAHRGPADGPALMTFTDAH